MNNVEQCYITPKKIKKQFDITSTTLRRWSEQGKIQCIRPNSSETNGGKRIYNINDIKRILGLPETVTIIEKKRICYARVSSSHQKGDLDRQIELLEEKYPNTTIIKDIGSGLNWKRSGFKTLLEQVHSNNISEVVVTYRDRLCRFGYELLEWIFEKHNVKVMVLFTNCNNESNPTNELAEDLLAITTVFVARNNGLRAGVYKKSKNNKTREENNEDTNE